MPTTRKRQTTSRTAAPKKAAVPEAAPAAVEDEKTVEATAPAVAPETAAEPGANAAEVSPSLTVQTPDAEVAPAQARASLLKAFTTGAPVVQDEPLAPAEPLFTTGKRDDWTNGEGGVEALVIVELFKATLNGHTHFGYKGTIITAPEAVVERGIRFGALSKEF